MNDDEYINKVFEQVRVLSKNIYDLPGFVSPVDADNTFACPFCGTEVTLVVLSNRTTINEKGHNIKQPDSDEAHVFKCFRKDIRVAFDVHGQIHVYHRDRPANADGYLQPISAFDVEVVEGYRKPLFPDDEDNEGGGSE